MLVDGKSLEVFLFSLYCRPQTQNSANLTLILWTNDACWCYLFPAVPSVQECIWSTLMEIERKLNVLPVRTFLSQGVTGVKCAHGPHFQPNCHFPQNFAFRRNTATSHFRSHGWVLGAFNAGTKIGIFARLASLIKIQSLRKRPTYGKTDSRRRNQVF